jgi:hypothetical protein
LYRSAEIPVPYEPSEWRQLAPWPDVYFVDAPLTRRIVELAIPARPDPLTFTGSAALACAGHPLAEVE